VSAPFVKAIRVAEVAPGGMKAVELSGRELVICNCDGSFHAVSRRCGHMNAPLEQGTLEGSVLTCPMHCAQFDVVTGEALSGPVPRHLGTDPLPATVGTFLANVGVLMKDVRTESVVTYLTKAEAGWVWVALPP
jgi:3-phenylpropionate/trans-cinnamate dioxygenase ferredoxin subunit/naphthalene 1,2-dioxygenase system ferredoxin subunit